jgi:hypothetical protein
LDPDFPSPRRGDFSTSSVGIELGMSGFLEYQQVLPRQAAFDFDKREAEGLEFPDGLLHSHLVEGLDRDP